MGLVFCAWRRDPHSAVVVSVRCSAAPAKSVTAYDAVTRLNLNHVNVNFWC